MNVFVVRPVIERPAVALAKAGGLKQSASLPSGTAEKRKWLLGMKSAHGEA